MTRHNLRNMFGFHILALEDTVSDVGFVVTTFVVWQGQNPGERDQSLLVIGILSTIALVGCQLYVRISVYVGLMQKLPGCDARLIQNLRANEAMHRQDWLLLIPGLLLLETDVIKHLSLSHPILTNATKSDGFTHGYFARLAFMAILFEYFYQIVIQIILIVVIEGTDGWAITGVIGSLTLSVGDSIVKTAFPLLTKSRASSSPPIEIPLSE